MCEKQTKPIKVFPEPVVKKVKRPKNATGYYQCMLNASLNGFNGQPITQVCRNCKVDGAYLNLQRNQEITNLMTAYEQLGNSLRTLTTLLSHVNHTPI